MAKITRVTLPPQRGVINVWACEGKEIGGITMSSLLVNILYVLKQAIIKKMVR